MLIPFDCDAILFDLDGVLVDSQLSIRRQWDRWVDQHAIPADRVAGATHGRRTVDTVRHLAPHLDADREARAIEEAQERDPAGVGALPGARELLATLPDGRWAVVTSATRALAASRLRACDLPVPAVLIAAEDVADGKPDPAGYLRAARTLGLDAAGCVVIEDAAAGALAGHRAGMRVISVGPAAAAHAQAVVVSLTELWATAGPTGVRLTVCLVEE